MEIQVYSILFDDGVEVYYDELKDAQENLRDNVELWDKKGAIYYVSLREIDRELVETHG